LIVVVVVVIDVVEIMEKIVARASPQVISRVYSGVREGENYGQTNPATAGESDFFHHFYTFSLLQSTTQSEENLS
jgi:hypothetical protein